MFAAFAVLAAAAAYWFYVNHQPQQFAEVKDPHGYAASVKYNGMG